MSKRTKTSVITASALIVIGILIFTAAMFINKWDFKNLSTEKYEENIHTVDENFDNIEINTETADINFAISDNGRCSVVCYEEENCKHTVITQNGTLKISLSDKRKWYDHIGINFDTVKVTVFLPKSEYNSFKIKVSTGDIDIKNLEIDTLDISVSTGSVNLSDIQCKNLNSAGSTGDMSLNNVISEKISIERTTGDIIAQNSDANDIVLTTATGDVTGKFLTDKQFIAKTSTGKIDVPKKDTGGKCKIVTSTGDIIFK